MKADLSSEPKEKYSPLRSLAPDLFIVDGEWRNTRFKRRMTIIRLRSGELIIHSPIHLRDKDYRELDGLGSVAYILAPNRFHGSEAPYYRYRYPKARLLLSLALKKSGNEFSSDAGLLPLDFPFSIKDEIECIELDGTRLLHENIFFDKKSRTLIVTDLVFHLCESVGGMEGMFFRWNKIAQRFGPSRIFEWLFLRDRAKAKASLQKILAWDFDRVVMSHGEVLEQGGREALRAAFAEIGLC